MCKLTGISKSRTTPYHPQGNGACEKFNSTLLGLLGTLAEDKKIRWKEYLNTLVFAYNCTPHQTTGFAPYELLFGRIPRLPIDFEFGLTKLIPESRSYDGFVEDLKERIKYSHTLAHENMTRKAGELVQASPLKPNDRVLIRKVGIIGRHKLSNRWNETVYIVVKQTDPAIPVYHVKPEAGGKSRVIHRNMILPIGTVNRESKPVPKPRKRKVQIPVVADIVENVQPVVEIDDSSSDDEVYMYNSRGDSPIIREIGSPVSPLDHSRASLVPSNRFDDVSYHASESADIEQNSSLHTDNSVYDPSVGNSDSVAGSPSPIPAPRRSRRQLAPVDRYQADMFSLRSDLLLQLIDKLGCVQ